MFDFKSFPAIETLRLRLRELTRADTDAMVAIFRDPEMYRFLNQPLIDTAEKAIELIDYYADKFKAGAFVTWAIALKSDGRVIGMGGNYDWQRDDSHIDIGYHIIPDLWGKGYATEAARAIVDWTFLNLDVHRVQADCTEGNIGSERVLLKCGFTQEGLWRESCWEHERFVNIKQFGLLRSEWEASRKHPASSLA